MQRVFHKFFRRQLPVSMIRGVDDSLYQLYAKSATLISTMKRVSRKFFRRRLSVSMILGVDDSFYQLYAESVTTRIVDGSRFCVTNIFKDLNPKSKMLQKLCKRHMPNRFSKQSIHPSHWYVPLNIPID